MAEHPTPSAPWVSPFSDKPYPPSPMVHDDDGGVAELVLESGQLLARRPRSGLRPLSSARLSCPSRLDKLDSQCDEDEPRAAEEQHAWIDSHLVPEYKDTADLALNNDIIPKVPDNHQVQHRPNQNPITECNLGWGPIGRMQQHDHNEPRLHNFAHILRPSRLLRPDGRQSTNSCSTSSTNGPNSSARLDRGMQRQSSASGKTPPVESTLVESGSRSVKALGNQLGLLATGGATEEAGSLGDDGTKFVANIAARDKNPERGNTSVCSLAASNNIERLKGRDHYANSNGEQGRKRKRRSGMQAPQMAPPPSMGMGMGMNMPMGLGCIPNPFSTSPVLGLPGQMLPVPMPQLQPFGHLPVPTGGSSSNLSIPMPGVDLLGSAPPFIERCS